MDDPLKPSKRSSADTSHSYEGYLKRGSQSAKCDKRRDIRMYYVTSKLSGGRG